MLNIGGSTKVTETRAAINADPEMERARQDVLNAYAKRKMTQVMLHQLRAHRCPDLP